jgi:hypothetical protein
MGLKEYFRAKAPPSTLPQVPEKSHSPPESHRGSGVVSGVISSASSAVVDDIKHDVMVNYLYQQQCSHMWHNPGGGGGYYEAPASPEEGVLLRKTRGVYMTYPPALSKSPLADACNALNVQVTSNKFHPAATVFMC